MKKYSDIFIVPLIDFTMCFNFLIFTHIKNSNIINEIVFVYILTSLILYVFLILLNRYYNFTILLCSIVIIAVKEMFLIIIYIGQTF